MPNEEMHSQQTSEPLQDSHDSRRLIETLAVQLGRELQLNGTLEAISKETAIELTPSAQVLLLVPLSELQDRYRRQHAEHRRMLGLSATGPTDTTVYDGAVLEASLRKMAQSMAQSPADQDRAINAADVPPPLGLKPQRGIRTALSAIKAYANTFCSIPPFCGPREPQIARKR